MFQQACLYGRDKAYFQSCEFCWNAKNKVKGYIPERNLGYQVGATGSGYCPLTASGYDGDDAAGCVTDYVTASCSGDTQQYAFGYASFQ
jgi:hypothetical protein